jgi:hypothetical protein
VESAEKKEIMTLSAEVITLKQQLDDNKRVSSEQWQKRRYEDAPQWMKNPPMDMSERKIEGNYEYRWCHHHKLWQRHDPEECRLNPSNRGRRQVTRVKTSTKPPPRREKRNYREEKRPAKNHQRDSNQQKRPLKKNKYNSKYNNKRRVAFQAADDDEESYYSDIHEYDEEEETLLIQDYDYGDYKEQE